MRSVMLVVGMVVLAVLAGAVLSRPDATAAATTGSVGGISGETGAAAPVVQQEGPAVTVRVGGNRDNVRIGNSRQAQGRKGRVRNPGLERAASRAALSVEDQGVSMAEEGTSGEGLLTRIHVDADDDLTAVIGFYTAIDSEMAIEEPNTYSCKRCGSVLVCGVDPQCQ